MENQSKNVKQQLIDRLKESNNVLVTVSRNPSVDQLSAAIGLTLMLNHLGKHGTAVFSGSVPDTLEFLKPEETLEKTTDSLRDFIISLDKAKADKLRYKAEDKMVKIFITPYRTSLSEADLIYEQGDFNVDVVVAIGVHDKEELDEAIINHGRILHDAAVATVNTANDGQLGSINWVDANASSLSEMLVSVCEALKPGQLDAQMATAFLTGIVAETERFSNEKASSDTMNISAKLMSAGANQQLVATQLEQHSQPLQSSGNSAPEQAAVPLADSVGNDGSLDIAHEPEATQSTETESDLPEVQPDHEPEAPQEEDADKPSRLILGPPSLGSKLTANAEPESLDPSIDPLPPHPATGPLLTHDKDDQPTNDDDDKAPTVELEDTPFSMTPPPAEPAPAFEPTAAEEPQKTPAGAEVSTEEEPSVESPTHEPEPPLAPPSEAPAEAESQEPVDNQTLSDLEDAVDSPHVADAPAEEPRTDSDTPDADAALAAARQAFDAIDAGLPEKPAAFNASGPMEVAHDEPVAEQPAVAVEPTSIAIDPATGQLSYPSNLVPPTGLPSDPTATSVEDPTAPPPVPPPMAMPPLMPQNDSSANQQIDPNNLPPVQ